MKEGCKEQFCSLGWLTERDYDIVVEVATCSSLRGIEIRLINVAVILELWEFCILGFHFRGKLFFSSLFEDSIYNFFVKDKR